MDYDYDMVNYKSPKRHTLWNIVYFVLGFVLGLVIVSLTACSSHHYFSINAEEITNPNIQYHDSTEVRLPWLQNRNN